jgi:hypothetical protein
MTKRNKTVMMDFRKGAKLAGTDIIRWDGDRLKSLNFADTLISRYHSAGS